MEKIKAYIVYGGSPDWYSATLVFENGWAAFGHLCSHPGFMLGDLWARRPERIEALKEMGYEVEVVGEPYAGSNHPDIQWLVEKNKDESNYKEMRDKYAVIKKRMEEQKQ